MKILNIRNNPQEKERATEYFQKIWANENSKMVYEDCITRSTQTTSPLPIWYLLIDEEKDKIIGCCGLITNDFISNMDLWPWLAALYIEKEYRGHNYAELLIEQVKRDTKKAGYPNLYLCTDHIGYYEKFGFIYECNGYHPWGEVSRVYKYALD